jgi:pSer/pThr/pTyr-binding forkhead associated (FHA) protein
MPMASNAPSPERDSAEPVLVPRGDFAGKPPLKISKSVIVVGAAEHCHLHLVSSSVSRHHALIIRDEDGVYIRDLGSRTKVVVNGQPCRETLLANADVLQIGKFSFTFSMRSPATGAADRLGPVRIMVNGKPLPDQPQGRTLLIGHGDECDIPLDGESVSHRHAIIFTARGQRYLRDLDSRTGTFLNGQKIHQHELGLGDEIRVGETRITLTKAPEQAAPSPESAEAAIPLEPAPEQPTAAADAAIDLSNKPIPLELDTEFEAAQHGTEAPEQPAASGDAEIDLSNKPIPLELAPEAEAKLEPLAPPDEPAMHVLNLAYTPAALPLEPEEPTGESAEPAAESTEPAAEPATGAIDHPGQSETTELPQEAEREVEIPPPSGEPAISAIDPSDDAPPMKTALQTEPKVESPEPPAEPASPVLDLSAAPAAIDLEPIITAIAPSDETPPMETALQTEPKVESPEPPAEPVNLTLDLSAAPAAIDLEPAIPGIDSSDEAPPLEMPLETESKVESPEPAVETTSPIVDFSDVPVALDLESATPVIDPHDETPEPPVEPASAILDFSDMPAALDLEPAISAIDPPDETVEPASAILDFSAAPAATDSVPEPESAVPVLDLSDAPVIAELDVPAADVDLEPKSPAVESTADAEGEASAPIPSVDMADIPAIAEFQFEPATAPVDLSDVPAVSNLESAAEPLISELDFSGVPSVSEPDAQPLEIVAHESAVDPGGTVIDIAVAPNPAEEKIDPASTPGAVEPPPEARSADADADSNDDEVSVSDQSQQRIRRPRQRPAPAEPKPRKSVRARVKRIPPKSTEQEVPEQPIAPAASASELRGGEPAPEIQPPAAPVEIQPAPIPAEIPDAAVSAAPPPDVAPAGADDIPAEVVAVSSSAPGDIPVPDEIPIPAEISASDEIPAPPSPDVPAPEPVASSTPPVPPARAPLGMVGTWGFIGGGTVNIDHFLGGMPIRLPELPPIPRGFGRIRIDTSSKPPPAPDWSPPAPLVAPPMATPWAATPAAPEVSSAPEDLSAPDVSSVPEVSSAPDASPAPDVSPAPEAISDPPPPAKPKTPPPIAAIPRPSRKLPFSTDLHELDFDKFPPSAHGPALPAGPSTAFDGMAISPAAGVDVFSNFEAAQIPINDAVFGGAPTSRPDQVYLPESPELAERRAEDVEPDFANDDFWNRTDEEDGVAPSSVPPPTIIPPPVIVPPPISVPPQAAESTTESPSPQPSPEVRLDEAPPSPGEGEMPTAINQAEPPSQPITGDDDLSLADTADGTAALDDPSGVAPPSSSPEEEIAMPQELELDDAIGNDAETPASPDTHASPAELSAASPVEPPTPGKRRRFRIPFLMPLILAGIGAALFAIWRLLPVQSQVVGKINFVNFGYTPGTRESVEFEAGQRRFFNGDLLRQHAADKLHGVAPGLPEGFLGSSEMFARVASSISLSASDQSAPPQTLLELSYAGADKDGDRARMLALLQSLADFNAPQVDVNRRLRDSEFKARQAVEDDARKLDQVKIQLGNLQAAIDAEPPIDELTRFAARKAELERVRLDADDAVNRDRADVARLEAPAAGSAVAAATQPDVADAQLDEMRQQLKDLTAEVDSARSDQVAGAAMARRQLEAAAQQFNDRIASANQVFASAPQLRQFVDSAMDSQAKARDLINMLMVDGEDLERQLEDTRRDVEDLIAARQAEKWADDPQLQQLRQKLESAQHRYNANVGQEITDTRILDPLQREIDACTLQIKDRQDQLGIDPGEIKVQEELNHVIQSLRNKLQREKQQTDEVLDPLEKELGDLDPVVAALPAAQQDLAKQIHQRLDALNEARRKYAQAVGDDQLAPSAKITDLQNRISDLKIRIAARQTDLIRNAVTDRDAQWSADLTAARAKLAADQKTLDAATKSSAVALTAYEDDLARHRAAVAAQRQKLGLLDDRHALSAGLEAAQRDWDDKKSAADHAFDIRPVTDADVTAPALPDPRMMYSLIVALGGLLALAALTFFSHSAVRAPRTTPPTDAELDSLAIPLATSHGAEIPNPDFD